MNNPNPVAPDPDRTPPEATFLDRWVALMRGITDFPEDLRLICESLATYADQDGRSCRPGNKKLALDTRLGAAAVSESLKSLRKMNLIELMTGDRAPAKGPNEYHLIIPEDIADMADGMVCNGLHKKEFQLPGDGLVSPLLDDNIFPIATPNPAPAATSQAARPRGKEKRTGVRRRETVLYRYYDDQDVLLYVGVSANMPGRLEGHEADSTWMDFAVRSTLDHFTDRDEAERVEQEEIEERRPLFNILHNECPDRVRRIVDYLIERDRRDLLVPLISRG